MAKIYLVEDDPTMLELLNTLFMLEGFEVAFLDGNEDFLESIKTHQPDLIILDVYLRVGGGREVNGFELLAQIRSVEDLQDVKVIMSSGIDYRVKSKEVGADDFVLKPFMPDELIQKIKNLVE